jgi:hypothetical protein
MQSASQSNNSESSQERRYSHRLRCRFCRRNGHRYEDCPAHLVSRLYFCIGDEREPEKMCFIVIRTFTIREISKLYKAIHDERNLHYDSIEGLSFMYLVPTIIDSVLQEFEEDELLNQNVNPNTSVVFPNPLEENLPLQLLRRQEEEANQMDTFHSEAFINTISSPVSVYSFPNPEELFHLPPLSTAVWGSQPPLPEEENPSHLTMTENNENPETNEFTDFHPNIFDESFHSREHPDIERMDEDDEEMPRFPPPAPAHVVSYMDDGNNTPRDEFMDDMPSLVDVNGNIMENEFFTEYFQPRNNNNNDYYHHEIYSPNPNPIQITLNKTIEIIAKNDFPVTEETNCPVCYEAFQEKKIIKTQCGHCFCFDCITKFTKHKNNCPMCRGAILQLNVHMDNLIV